MFSSSSDNGVEQYLQCCREWRKQTAYLSGVCLNTHMLTISGKYLIVMNTAKLTMYCFLLNETSQRHTYILLNIQVSFNYLGSLANPKYTCIRVIFSYSNNISQFLQVHNLQELRNIVTVSVYVKEREKACGNLVNELYVYLTNIILNIND